TNHNSGATVSQREQNETALSDTIRHIYVHVPFCARICPYCAFYKELLDRSQTPRFCEALLGALRQEAQDRPAPRPEDSYFAEVAGSPSSFNSRRSRKDSISDEGAARPRRVRRHLLPSTIYFGGGTPTA